MTGKPILVLDFDGVIHSYSSGWKGARNIPDPPVDGALEFIVKSLPHFTVAIFSSRSHQWGGRRAMKRWLHDHLFALGTVNSCPQWWQNEIAKSDPGEPWDHNVSDAARSVVKAIQWPVNKPPALMTIDDRALTFNGDWSDPAYSVEGVRAFRPWNKRPDKIEMPGPSLAYDPAFLALRKMSP